MFCKNCGSQLPDGVAFCTACGTPVPVAPQAPVMPQPPMAPQAPVNPYAQPIVPGKGLGVASMVLGIVSLVLFCIWYLAIPCAIIGAALGGVAQSKAKAAGVKNGMAVAGITCSCIALGVAILFLLLGIIGLASIGAFA